MEYKERGQRDKRPGEWIAPIEVQGYKRTRDGCRDGADRDVPSCHYEHDEYGELDAGAERSKHEKQAPDRNGNALSAVKAEPRRIDVASDATDER